MWFFGCLTSIAYMIAIPNYNYLSPEAYLTLEAESHVKHEYIDGEV